MKDLPKLPGFHSTEECAKALRYKDPSFIHRLIREKRVTAYRLGRRGIAIPDAEVDRLKAEVRKPGPKAKPPSA
jgi:excisionase family DNA binding protein